MAQVRARRPYVSRRGYVNGMRVEPDALESQAPETPQTPDASQVLEPPPAEIVVQLPNADEVVGQEQVHPGHNETLQGVTLPADGVEREFVYDTPSLIDEPVGPEPSKVDYRTWNVTQLVAELKRRELQTSGNKAELVARLEASDGTRTE